MGNQTVTGDGRVRPARTGLRLTVEAMLSRTQGRVPLSLLIGLVNQTGYHPDVPARSYRRLAKAWHHAQGFPLERIVWDR